jgi:DNA-directed RNA polymerase specialized sigma24 family protein
MNRRDGLRRLSKPYADALRLHEEGRDDEIARRLGIEPEAVGPLIQVAEAKLARLLEGTDGREPARRKRRERE